MTGSGDEAIQLRSSGLPGVWILQGRRHVDGRGAFEEVWNERDFHRVGINHQWVQLNEAHSVHAGTLRGIHHQIRPCAQTKLVRVVHGAVFDVAVDLRRASATFGQHVAVRIQAGDGRRLLIPTGFGHGYLTLEPDTVVQYLVDAPYSPEHERGIRWDDADLAIPWPLPPTGPILSDRDRGLPPLPRR